MPINPVQPPPTAGELTNRRSPGALLRRRLTPKRLIILGALTAILSALPATANAAVIHEYLEHETEEISATSNGNLGEPRSMALDGGPLWEANTGALNEFDAESGKFVSSLSVGTAGEDGIAVGHLGGGEQVYLSDGGPSVYENGVRLGAWGGTHVPRGIISGIAVDDSVSGVSHPDAGDV
jgi:hypothetical protein